MRNQLILTGLGLTFLLATGSAEAQTVTLTFAALNSSPGDGGGLWRLTSNQLTYTFDFATVLAGGPSGTFDPFAGTGFGVDPGLPNVRFEALVNGIKNIPWDVTFQQAGSIAETKGIDSFFSASFSERVAYYNYSNGITLQSGDKRIAIEPIGTGLRFIREPAGSFRIQSSAPWRYSIATIAAAPEPGALPLLALGGVLAVGLRRRAQTRRSL